MKVMKYNPASREITASLYALLVLGLFYFHFQYVRQYPDNPVNPVWKKEIPANAKG